MALLEKLCWKCVKFDMSNTKVVSTPLENHFKLLLDKFLKIDARFKYMSKAFYASVIGSLMCVMVCTTLDFTQAISQVC